MLASRRHTCHNTFRQINLTSSTWSVSWPQSSRQQCLQFRAIPFHFYNFLIRIKMLYLHFIFWDVFFSVSHICKQPESLMVTYMFSPQMKAFSFECDHLTFLHFHEFHLFSITIPTGKMIKVKFIKRYNYRHWMIRWTQMLQDIMVVGVQSSVMTLQLRPRHCSSFKGIVFNMFPLEIRVELGKQLFNYGTHKVGDMAAQIGIFF